MVATTDPVDVVRAVAAGVSRLQCGGLDDGEQERELDALARRYAEHTDVRHPFAPLGDTPMFTRDELRAHFGAGEPTPGVERFEAVDLTVHRTGDPEVVVVEFRYAGVVAGRAFAVPCIFVVRVRDGQIVESRDYVDHVGMARAFGRLEALGRALAADAARAAG